MAASDDELAQRIINHMVARGMPISRGAGELTIAYVEGMDHDGTLNDDAIDGWNDLRLVLSAEPPRILFKCQATTEPGTYYDRQHVIGTGPKGKGAALIALGYQAAWQVGFHHNDPEHEALVQTGDEVTVYRDYDKSFRRQDGSTHIGWFGINQHGPGRVDGNPTSVGPHSAGCLVARRMADHRAFMALIKTDPRYKANPKYVFGTAVISGRELVGAPAQAAPRPLTPTAVAPAAASGTIIDTAQNVTQHLSELRQAGVGTIIRYLTTAESSDKCVKDVEAKAIGAAGMQLGLVFEIWGGTGNFKHGDITANSGTAHADFVLRHLPTIGAPTGCGVYFAIDTDASPEELERLVVPYFRAVRQKIGGAYRVGAYCSGLVAARLRELALVDLIWITCSLGFRGSREYVAAGKQDIWQSKCDTNVVGLDVDLDVANRADWGQFAPFDAGAPARPQPAAPASSSDWPAAWGPQDGEATWYSDSTNADGTPVNNQTDMSCATQNRTIPFGTKLRVTRTDTGASAIVAVHDRGGPALSGRRLVDLRPAAAAALGFGAIGVAPVRLDLATAATRPAPAPPPPPPVSHPTPAANPEVERKLAAITAAIRPIIEEKPMSASSPDSPPDIWKVLAGLAQAVKDIQEGKTAPATPAASQPEEELSIFDKIFGGKTFVGSKTAIGGAGIVATVLSNVLGFSDSSMPAAQIAMTAASTVFGAGILGKVDRGVKIAKVAIPILRKIVTTLQSIKGDQSTTLPTIWTPPQ